MQKPQTLTVREWEIIEEGLRERARCDVVLRRVEEWLAYERSAISTGQPYTPPKLTEEEKLANNRQSLIHKLGQYEHLTDLNEVGHWGIYGEDANCDLSGPHSMPLLGTFDGTLSDAIDAAIRMPGFYTWGGGGSIRRVKKVERWEPA